jgi:FAD/FMN-containing dehydrogenase
VARIASRGYSVSDGALVIDLSRMNGVSVDAETRRARVEGGALLADLDAAALAHGLATPAGMISHTGVGGLTVGGGMGWLSRLGAVRSTRSLLKSLSRTGQILQVDDQRHPDLFWVIRGGGGNFGVVTGFEFRLHEIGPMVQFGLFFWGLDQGAAALRLMRDLVHVLPISLNAVSVAGLTTPPAPFVPPEYQFATGYNSAGMLIMAAATANRGAAKRKTAGAHRRRGGTGKGRCSAAEQEDRNN